MNALRRRCWTRLAVLLLHVLVMGVASASPWLHGDDGARAVRCGAPRGAPGAADAERGLDCPLCLPLQAPPTDAAPRPGPSQRDGLAADARAIPGDTRPVVLPPARAPPRV